MLKKTLFLIALVLLPLQAEENNPRCLGIELGAEFLYWKPIGTEIDFAAALLPVPEAGSPGNTDVKFCDFDPRWSPGLRGSASILHFFRGMDVKAEYTFLTDRTHQTLIADEGYLVSPLIHKAIVPIEDPSDALLFNEAKGLYDFEYHRFDAFLGGNLEACESKLLVRYLIGSSGLILNQSFDSEFSNPDITTIGLRHSWDSHFWGVGLNIGTQLDFYTHCLCKFFIRAHGLLLAGSNAGETTHYFLEGEDEEEWTFQEPRKTCWIVPGFEFAAGIDWGLSTANHLLTVRVGYQFTEYWNTPSIRGFLGRDSNLRISQSTPSNIGNFGFHGLFVGLNAGF